MNVKLNKLIAVAVILLQTQVLFAQFNCRSMLGNFVTPLTKNSPFSWGTEATLTYGLMNDRDISSGMLFLGVDYTKNKNQIYFEGGWKAYRNSLDLPPESSEDDIPGLNYFQKNRLGLREAFYRYRDNKTSVIAGLHSMQSADHFMLNERVVGISAQRQFSAFTLHLNGGSVMRDFVRMGYFCQTRYLYNIRTASNEIHPGKSFGETNFTDAIIIWDPNFVAEKKSSGDEFKSSDEFSSNDEFKSNDEFSSTENKPKESSVGFKKYIKNVGLLIFDEFGEKYDKNRFFAGLFTTLDLPYRFSIKIEAANQLLDSSNAMAYLVKATKAFGEKINTDIELAYFGQLDFDENAHFMASFSNYYMGEVMRMDLVDLPVLIAGIHQAYPGKMKPSLRLRMARQINDFHAAEYDLELGFKPIKNAKLTGIFSYIQSDVFDSDKYMARVELRLAF